MDKSKLSLLPLKPGVYLMKDKFSQIIYIGKAKNIKNRVSSYFQNSDKKRDIKTEKLISNIVDVDYIITKNEKEAFILENTLIKKYKPKYNITLKDDKNYLMVLIDTKSEFPRLKLSRKRGEERDTIIFGPFSSAEALKNTLKFITKIFPLRTCSDEKFKRVKRPCILYQIKRCSGPCHNKITKEDYINLVKGVKLFFQGKNQELIDQLKSQMEEKSELLQFEEAAKIRDQILAIEKSIESQKISRKSSLNQDIISYYKEGDEIEVVVIFVRNGQLIDKKSYHFSKLELSSKELIYSFITQFYIEDSFIPEEILIPEELEDKEVIEEWLSEKKKGDVKIVCPKKGALRELLNMAEENAYFYFKRWEKTENNNLKILKEIKEKLFLKELPQRIECFDISSYYGTFSVGACVSFVNLIPDKKSYKRFKIKGSSIDDLGMLSEVLTRRLTRGIKEGNLPNLIIIDGGKGQLRVAEKIINSLKINIDVIAIAKDRTYFKDENLYSLGERIFISGKDEPIILENKSPLYLITRIRDDAHRFAITYHRKLKLKMTTASILNEIPGVGEKRKKILLKYFGSLKRIKEATLEELYNLPFIDKKTAYRIYQFFENVTSS